MDYWQIGIGDGQVDMVEIFKKLQIALIGPGRFGDFFDNREQYDSIDDGHLVKTFAERVNIGDVFVLKHIENPQTKTWRIFAVGTVVSPYRFEPIFDKVDNLYWDVQHCRRVKWIFVDNVVVQKGGAPIRIQKLNEDNPLRIKADEILCSNSF